MDKDFRPKIESATDWARKDETSKGSTCPDCGALLPPLAGPINRHRAFHERIDTFIASQPGAVGGDNGGA